MRTALQGAGLEYESAESSFVPSVTVPLDEEGARKIFKLIDALEDCDDVQNVYANFDVCDEVMALSTPDVPADGLREGGGVLEYHAASRAFGFRMAQAS